ISDLKAHQGAGLGLSISKAFVELMGGRIWVKSEEGKGSTFYFTTPYKPHTERKTEITPLVRDTESLDIQIRELKVLIVEDDEISVQFMKAMLNKICGTVFHAESGFKAIDVCKENSDLDLILMDIRMPDMNGYEATRQIREFNKDIIIIAQTAFAQTYDRIRAIEAGCNDYITKPILKEAFLPLIQKYF
ncbi:MAG: response regulator, partial [Bacteroidales bacterium]|nr:response regulator [Bacteroidales bacterium]